MVAEKDKQKGKPAPGGTAPPDIPPAVPLKRVPPPEDGQFAAAGCLASAGRHHSAGFGAVSRRIFARAASRAVSLAGDHALHRRREEFFLRRLSAFAALGGCLGYHIGPVKPNYLSDVHTIAVPTFKNNTLIPRIEALVTGTVIKQFQQDGTFTIAREAKCRCDFERGNYRGSAALRRVLCAETFWPPPNLIWSCA